jgi:hypothetical protein
MHSLIINKFAFKYIYVFCSLDEKFNTETKTYLSFKSGF